MHGGIPRRRPARPVSDAALEQLEARGEELAKAWLLELIESRPLSDAAGLLAGGLGRDGPRLCAAVIRALGSDRELSALAPDGRLSELAAGAGALTGASDPAEALEGLAALSSVIWAAARDALADPDPELIARLAERLARVDGVLRSAALRGRATPRWGEHGRARAAASSRPPEAPAREREDRPAAARRPPAEGLEETRSPLAEPLWRAAIDEEVARARAGVTPLSLLLVELEDADRLREVEPSSEAAAVFSRFAQALRGALRREDLFARAGEERAWVIARSSDRRAARALAERIAAAVASAEGWRGAPLRASIGLAVLGEDGFDGASLIEQAEQSQLASLAAGVPTLG